MQICYISWKGGRKNCIEKFVENLHKDAKWIINILKSIIPPCGDEEPTNTICYICEKKLELGSKDNVIDHCHLTGKIRGWSHSACNIMYTTPKFIPVVFHNLSGYDSHLFIKSTSLQKLANNLEPNQFKILPNFINTPNMMKLLTRKGVFPYEYVDCWEKLEEISLPPKENFYSQLSDSHISDGDYEHAQVVWNAFCAKTLGEYSDLYLKTDVLLLAEVFENFRTICLITYKLDPCQYLTTPSLSWNAMMKYTAVELQLLTDYEMIQFVKSAIRGGISQVSKRYSEANNKFMKNYNANEDDKFMVYLDVNNLYGDSMRRCLPIDIFRWLDNNEIIQFDVTSTQSDSNVGYFLEVDLEYPRHLHNTHNDYPFCGETKKPPGGKTKKLLLTLQNKSNYVIHYLNLKQCLQNGLICKKIHRILSFN